MVPLTEGAAPDLLLNLGLREPRVVGQVYPFAA